MSLPTNTWISVDRADELPSEYYEIDVTDGYTRQFDCIYNAKQKEWITDRVSFTPTHFMIIELPK